MRKDRDDYLFIRRRVEDKVGECQQIFQILRRKNVFRSVGTMRNSLLWFRGKKVGRSNPELIELIKKKSFTRFNPYKGKERRGKRRKKNKPYRKIFTEK